MYRTHGIAALAVLLIVACAALLLCHPRTDRSFEGIRERGFTKIGYALEAPYAFLSPQGTVTGGSPELAKHVVHQLGIPKIHWVQSEFDSLISSLEFGRFDVIAAGMFITAERAERICFSNPSFHATQGLLVARGNPWNLHSYEQVRDIKDVKVFVIGGAVEEELFRDIGVPGNQLVIVPDALTGRVAVESQEAAALALTAPTIRWMARQDKLGKTEMAQPFRQPEATKGKKIGFGGFGFRKEDAQLVSAWNDVLKGFVNSPEHEKLIAPFGFTSDNLPGCLSAREVVPEP